MATKTQIEPIGAAEGATSQAKNVQPEPCEAAVEEKDSLMMEIDQLLYSEADQAKNAKN